MFLIATAEPSEAYLVLGAVNHLGGQAWLTRLAEHFKMLYTV